MPQYESVYFEILVFFRFRFIKIFSFKFSGRRNFLFIDIDTIFDFNIFGGFAVNFRMNVACRNQEYQNKSVAFFTEFLIK